MKITVDYKIHFWDNWTIYWQIIKIDKELMKKYKIDDKRILDRNTIIQVL